MNTANISDWLQVVGTFGVIASLLFVGLQMKQTHEIALSAAYQARTASSIDLTIGPMTSPEWLSGISKVYSNDAKSLTKEEHVALQMELWALMTIYENNHLQYQSGFLPEQHWQRNVRSMKCLFDLPYNRGNYSTSDVRSSFAAVVDDILEEAIENPSGCRNFKFDTLRGDPSVVN